MLHFIAFSYPVFFSFLSMKIQQLLVTVETQHLQLVMGQRLQQQGIPLLQLVKAYRPQLQVSLYMSHMLVVSV